MPPLGAHGARKRRNPNMTNKPEKTDTRRMPMMPIRDVVIFPHMMTPFVVGRESSVRALEEALAGDKKIFLATQHDASIDEPKPNEVFQVGTIATIVQSLRLPDNNVKVLVEGVERGRIVSMNDEDGYFHAVVRAIPQKSEPTAQTDAMIAKVNSLFEQYVKVSQSLRSYIERRISFALNRFIDRVRTVEIHLSDLNGPRGGVDKRCQVVVDGATSWVVRIDDTNESLHAAVDRAAAKAKQIVSRKLERAHAAPRLAEASW